MSMPELITAPAPCDDIVDASVGFQKLNLSPEMLSSVQHLGFETPSPIQEAAIPVIQQGLDAVSYTHLRAHET